MGCQGSGLGKTKACLVPGLALCLLLGPLAGEGLLCPSVLSPVLSCPPRGWWGPAWGALWGDGCPLPSQGPSLCRMTEVLYCCPLVPALARPGGEGEGAGAWGTWPLDQSGEVGTAGGTGASVLGLSSSPRGHSSDPEDSGIPVSDPWPPPCSASGPQGSGTCLCIPPGGPASSVVSPWTGPDFPPSPSSDQPPTGVPRGRAWAPRARPTPLPGCPGSESPRGAGRPSP